MPRQSRSRPVGRCLPMLDRPFILAALFVSSSVIAKDGSLVLDDRSSGNLCAGNGACWQAIADTVMGGVSVGRLRSSLIDGRPCLRLSGEVSLLNNGGFLQASLDLDQTGPLDARGYAGVEIDIFGNGESYNLHLRTADTRVVWQSYRTGFVAKPIWRTLRLPFTGFTPHRIDKPLDLGKLRRLGLVAIGREMHADLCIAHLSFYRESPTPERDAPWSSSPAIPSP